MTAPRTYAVGDRVTIVGGPKLRADTGVVVEVKQDPLPYRVDFGAPWTPAWWSGLDLEPAAEAAPPSKAKVDGDFATVEEHIAAWKAGGRRWAKVEGFNVDAMQADEEAKRRAAAEAARPMLALAEREVAEALAQVPVIAWPLAIDEPRRYARVETDPVEARFVAMATAMAGDPALAAMSTAPDGTARVAGPMQIFATTDGRLHARMSDGSTVNLTDPVVGPASVDDSHDPIADRLVYLQRVQQRAQTDPEVHQTCDTQDAILDAVVTLLELAVRR